jgi:hypothetical protein
VVALVAAVLALSACTGDAGDGTDPVTPQLAPIDASTEGLIAPPTASPRRCWPGPPSTAASST